MRLLFSLIFVFGIFQSHAQSEAQLLKSVKLKLDKVKNYKASGKMIVDVSFIKAPPSNVTVYFKQPDKFKIVKDGGISLLPKGGVNINISALLSDNNYTAVSAGNALVKGVATTVIKLLPLNENSDVVLTTLFIDVKNALVLKTSVTTKESGSYEIELDYNKYAEWGLPDKAVFLFNTSNYKIPKGITFEYDKGTDKKKQMPKNKKGRVEVRYNNYIINKGVADAVFKS